MNERQKIRQFNQDVDRLLAGKESTIPQKATADYVATVEFAAMLTTVDFSTESQQRPQLRRRLLQQIAQPARTNKFSSFAARRVASVIAVILAVILFTAILAGPEQYAAAARTVQQIYDRVMSLGQTSLRRTSLQNDNMFEVVRDQDGTIISIERRGETAVADPEDQPYLFSDLTQAQNTVSYLIQQPTYLPPDYQFDHIYATELMADLWYQGPDNGVLRLVQVQLDNEIYQDEGFAVVASSDRSIEPVMVHGQTGGWLSEVAMTDLTNKEWLPVNLLIWEKNGISYVLAGTISQTEALRIAESLP